MTKKRTVGRKPKKTKARGGLKVEDFKYYDQLGLTLPQLVLGIEVDPRSEYSRDYAFKPGRQWVKLAHQTAGYARNQHYLICTILKPSSVELLQKMQQLANQWEDSQAGCWINPLETVLTYRASLNDLLGVDCNFCHKKFEEGFYPVDTEFLEKLTDEKFPKDLDDLIEWGSGWERGLGCIGRWGLFLLGQNSD